MRYLIALLCPPLAILMCGHLFLALFSILLCPFYFPAALLALLVASDYYAARREDRHFNQAMKIEKSYLKAYKSHVAEVNRGLRDERKFVRAERRKLESQAKAERKQMEADARALEPPREPRFTWDRAKAIAARTRELSIVAKESAVRAYRDLPEWAQPISWGLAAGSVASVGMMIFLAARR
jgi:hypothetical protein